MCKAFVALAYLRHSNESPIEIGYASSYGDAERAVERFAKCGSCEPVAYFRVEKRMYHSEQV